MPIFILSFESRLGGFFKPEKRNFLILPNFILKTIFFLNIFERYLNLNLKAVSEQQVRHLYGHEWPLSRDENFVEPSRAVKNENVQTKILLHWCQLVVQPYAMHIEDFTSSWKDGHAFCALVHRFRPDLVLDFSTPF